VIRLLEWEEAMAVALAGVRDALEVAEVIAPDDSAVPDAKEIPEDKEERGIVS